MMGTIHSLGTLQLRSFQQIPPFQLLATTQCDIYIYKKGFTNIGVKIRNPRITKKGNYQFDSIQIKIITQKVDSLQRWFKMRIDLKKQYKIQDEPKLKDQQFKQLNKKIRKALKQSSKQSNIIKEWREKQIDALIRIDKQKHKGYGEETGILKIQQLLTENPKIYYFKTVNYQSNSSTSNVFSKEQNKQNTSYPAIIHKLYS